MKRFREESAVKKTSRTTKRYLDAIASGTLTESDITALRSQLTHPTEHFDRKTVQKALLGALPLRLTPEHTQKGLTYLRMLMERDERRRTTPRAMTQRERSIVENFERFTFEGFYPLPTYGRAMLERLYGVHARDGRSFIYAAAYDAETRAMYRLIRKHGRGLHGEHSRRLALALVAWHEHSVS